MSTTKARTAVVAKELKDGEKAIQHSTVINPYALAELVAGRRISWREIDDAPRLLESLLETPYEQLFDPVYDSPLYLGFRLNAKLELEHVDVELPEVREDAGNDLESPNGVGTIARLADLGPLFETDDIGKIAVDRADLRTNALDLTIRLSDPLRKARLARVLPRDLLDLVVYRPKRVVSDGFNPPNTAWTDNGDFFEETTEFFDPIQGAVANCYLIAAMASVAWARPYLISHLTRATGQAQQQFTDMIRFYDIDHGNAEYDVEVTEDDDRQLRERRARLLPLERAGRDLARRLREGVREVEDRDRGRPARHHGDGVGRLRPRLGGADRPRPSLLRHGEPHRRRALEHRPRELAQREDVQPADRGDVRLGRRLAGQGGLRRREPRRLALLLGARLGLPERPEVHRPAQPVGLDRGDPERPRRHRLLLRRELVEADRAREPGRRLRPPRGHVQELLRLARRRELSPQERGP